MAGVVVAGTALVLALAYLRAAARRPGWSRWRSAGFLGGLGLLVVGLAPPVAAWAHTDLRGHMVQHLLIGMYAPVLLALSAPLSLLLGALAAPRARRLVQLLHARPLRVLVHPASVLVLNVGGMAVLYLTPLYLLSREHAGLHVLVHYHFLVAGCLYSWVVCGVDPAPARPMLRTRALLLLTGAAAHAVLGKFMYAHGLPQGTGAPLQEVQAAAQWMYYGGDLAELALATALFAQWYRRSAPRRQPGAPVAPA